ncbi:hypothetical protein BGZ54_006102 [Gamsiella multidivaricata]|nr:hypothetical protein BGZ54_006102 [Gamsiella multidivaricata]
MDSREALDVLISQSRQPDRPEIRANSSIGLVSLVAEKSAAFDDNEGDSKDEQMWIESWALILNGLADEWPLVREAFQEQLIKAIGQSEPLRRAVDQPDFIDQVMKESVKQQGSDQNKLDIVTGILSLAHLAIVKDEGVESELSATHAWDVDRVSGILSMAMEGYLGSKATPPSGVCELLAKSFTGSQLVHALGALTTAHFAQPLQAGDFASFSEAILRQASSGHTGGDETRSLALAIPVAKDWAFALWLCDQLRIPTVFASAESIQDSAQGRAVADTFVRRVPALLECIGHVLRIQSLDNTYTLHRLVIACAAFVNSKDLWNRLEPLVSGRSQANAQENLRILYQTTPWSIRSVPNAPPSDSTRHDRNVVMIPGSFSDHIIQIIEKEIRPCFTHVKAQKAALRAQKTIELHQEKMRQSAPLIEEAKDPGEIANEIVIPGNKSIMQRRTQGVGLTQRIRIASVIDTPNDEEETWTVMDDHELNLSNASQVRRWDKNFLEAVPVVEWCAQQPIQDPSRIHEVFMLLVSPILAMTDSLQPRHRIRGLDLLTIFLIQYQDASRGNFDAKHRRQNDSRIWIKIFERTGLDQVLERSLKPLLGPLQMGVTSTPGSELQYDDDNELERINAAFRAYLTLILVNTEPDDKPRSSIENGRLASLSSSGTGTSTSDLNMLTVENLFLQGVIGSLRKANPTKQYRALVLEWTKILVNPVVSFDFVWEQMHQHQRSLNIVPLETELGNGSTREQSFQGIYGLGSLTIKYLLTLVQHTCNILDFPIPSSPPSARLESLNLAWRASETLHAVMQVCKPRQGPKISRSSDSGTVKPTSDQPPEQLRLDQSLVKAMQLCINLCQPKITIEAPSGLDMDLKVLKELDPSVFDPLFVSE